MPDPPYPASRTVSGCGSAFAAAETVATGLKRGPFEATAKSDALLLEARLMNGADPPVASNEYQEPGNPEAMYWNRRAVDGPARWEAMAAVIVRDVTFVKSYAARCAALLS